MANKTFTVMIRAREKGKDWLIRAPIEFDARRRPFAVLERYIVRGREFSGRMPLDPTFLQPIVGAKAQAKAEADFIYSGPFDIPVQENN
jgi:hypothetical protein